jgi:hypothetical protein
MKLAHCLMLAISLVMPLSSLANEHAAHAQAEHKHAASQAKLTFNEGKKWHADEPLRLAMSHIRASVTTALPAIHSGKLTPAQYDALGKEIEGQIAFIVQNCKLDPKADAQLHIVIGDIAAGLELATAKLSTKKRASGIHKIAVSLNTYGKYFDHPDWQAIALGAH